MRSHTAPPHGAGHPQTARTPGPAAYESGDSDWQSDASSLWEETSSQGVDSYGAGAGACGVYDGACGDYEADDLAWLDHNERDYAALNGHPPHEDSSSDDEAAANAPFLPEHHRASLVNRPLAPCPPVPLTGNGRAGGK